MHQIHNNKRRNFMKFTGLLGLGLTFSPWSTLQAAPLSNKGKKIVTIHIAGGWDSLNVLVPYNDPNYYSMRPNLAIAKSNYAQGSKLILNQTFGLHPKMAALKTIWDNGDLCLFPATYNSTLNRSHFTQLISYGKGEYGSIKSSENKGWAVPFLNHLGTAGKDKITAFSFNPDGKMFQGASPSSYVSRYPESSKSMNNETIKHLKNIVKEKNRNKASLFSKYSTEQERVFAIEERIALFRDKLSTDYTDTRYMKEEKEDVYTDLSAQLKQTAILLSEINELSMVECISGGHDTHADQKDRQEILLEDVAVSLKAFYEDLKERNLLDDVVVIVKTEFGRTVQENGSAGTDHGHAGTWMAMGTAVKGGDHSDAIHGGWLALHDDNLSEGRYIKEQTDYRDILAEAIHWAGLDNASSSFAHYTYDAQRLPYLS